jgi:phosphoribosyl-ATP pyrophosphohydrolase
MPSEPILPRLWQTILERRTTLPEGSYTATLFRRGENEILKKLGEEAIEVLVAVKGESDDRVIYEAADLVYHLVVLLAARNLSWEQVEAELARRLR